MTQDTRDVNEYAKNKFEELRKKMKLDLQRPHIEKIQKVTEEAVNKMFDTPIGTNVHSVSFEEADKALAQARINSANVDSIFNFVESLNLPSNLSLAIGLIVAGYRTKDSNNFAKAIAAIGEHLNGKEKRTPETYG